MNQNIYDYFSFCHSGGNPNNKFSDAIHEMESDLGRDTKIVYVFISDVIDCDSDFPLWVFSENSIIRIQYNDRTREYLIIPQNAISNIILKFSHESTSVEFEYSGTRYSLISHAQRNKNLLAEICNSVFGI